MGIIHGYVKKNKESARNILAWYYLSKGFATQGKKAIFC